MPCRKNMAVYKITNIINNKCYIGSALSFGQRRSIHLHSLKTNTHYNSHLQNSYNKHGKDSFMFEIIKEGLVDNSELLFWEQYYIDKLKPKYNIRLIAESNRGIIRTEEQVRRIRLIRKGVPPVNKGVPMSDEQRNLTAKKVLCVDTGKIYTSSWDAGLEYKTKGCNIRKSCRLGVKAKGMIFKYLTS